MEGAEERIECFEDDMFVWSAVDLVEICGFGSMDLSRER